jgi:uncharacterized BrkB/YihY/UPF0761 family membrane protein
LKYIETNFGSDVGSIVQRLVQLLEQQSVIPLALSLGGLLVTASVLVGRLQMSFRAIWHSRPSCQGGCTLRSCESSARSCWRFPRCLRERNAGARFPRGQNSVNWLTQRYTQGWLLIPSSLLLVPLSFALMFRFLPPRLVPWRHVWFAALLCGATWLGVTRPLAALGSYFGKNPNTYGAVGTILAAMLWINIVSQLLFYGA